jgi:hypothetical protein
MPFTGHDLSLSSSEKTCRITGCTRPAHVPPDNPTLCYACRVIYDDAIHAVHKEERRRTIKAWKQIRRTASKNEAKARTAAKKMTEATR